MHAIDANQYKYGYFHEDSHPALLNVQSSNPVLDPGQHCPAQETTILEQRLVLQFPVFSVVNVDCKMSNLKHKITMIVGWGKILKLAALDISAGARYKDKTSILHKNRLT